jgi:hypothetical protein
MSKSGFDPSQPRDKQGEWTSGGGGGAGLTKQPSAGKPSKLKRMQDLNRVVHGAMTQAEFNAKYKVGPKFRGGAQEAMGNHSRSLVAGMTGRSPSEPSAPAGLFKNGKMNVLSSAQRSTEDHIKKFNVAPKAASKLRTSANASTAQSRAVKVTRTTVSGDIAARYMAQVGKK